MESTPVLSTPRAARLERSALPAVPSAPPRRRWTPWLMVVGLLTLAGSVAIVTVSLNPSSQAGSPDAPAARSDRRAVAVAFVDVEGGVRPLFTAVPGRVVEASVPEGKEVEKDTVLLRVDDALAQTRLKEAEIDYAAAKVKLDQAKRLVKQHQTKIGIREDAVDAGKKKLAAAKAVAAKAKNMLKFGTTQEDVEAANHAVAEAEAGVRVLQGELSYSQAFDVESAVRLATFEVEGKKEQVEKARLGVRECSLLAPCKGVILRRLVNVGEVLGQMSTRPAIEFCPSGERIVRAEVEQEFASKLFIGQKATITDDMTGSGNWEGEVARISDWFTQRRAVLLEPMQYNDIRTLEVILKLKPDTKNPLRINQRVRVQLAGEAGK